MSNMIINVTINSDLKELDPKPIQEKMKEIASQLASEWDSTPATTEVENKIHEAIKGTTIREAIKQLDRVKSDVMFNAPIDSGFDKVL